MLGLLLVALVTQEPSALLERGRLLMAQEAFAEAEKVFERAARRDGDSSRAHYYLGVCRLRLGKIEEAIAALARARDRAPGPNPAVLYELGSAYLQAGRALEGAEVLTSARDLAPDEMRIRLQLGWAYYQLVEGEKAEAEFRRVLERQPHSALAHFYMGLTEAALGELERSERSFRKTLSLDGSLVEARLGLARVLSQSGRRDEAKAELEEVLRSHPAHAASAHNELGLIALREGRPDVARGHFETVIASEPDNRQALYNLSLLYRRLGRHDDAEAMRARFESAKEEPVAERSLSRTTSKPKR